MPKHKTIYGNIKYFKQQKQASYMYKNSIPLNMTTTPKPSILETFNYHWRPTFSAHTGRNAPRPRRVCLRYQVSHINVRTIRFVVQRSLSLQDSILFTRLFYTNAFVGCTFLLLVSLCQESRYIESDLGLVIRIMLVFR